MRIAIVGLGGVGGYFGGKLARRYGPGEGHEVLFFCRGRHLEAISRHGLKVMAVDEEFTVVPAAATDRAEDLGQVDLVLFCVKGYDLEEVAATVAVNVHAGTVVLPLLNGVDAAGTLRSVIGRGMVLGGCVYISSHIEAPGVVQQTGGPRTLFFGPETGDVASYRHIESLLKDAGIKAELTGDIALELWTKYIFVGPFSGVSSLVGKTFGAILEDAQDRGMLEGMMGEVQAIARKRGIALPEDIVARSVEKGAGFPYDTKSSMQLDFEKGRRVELELFVGYLVRSGGELGVPTPLHERVYRELAAGLAAP
jgi:2-dehydropantoate 2-reductase